MKIARRVFGAALMLAAGLAGSASAAPDPYAVFARARAFFAQETFPPYLGYDVAVTVVEAGAPKVERYKSAFDGTKNVVWVDTVSDYEVAHPASGRGVNISFLVPLNKPEPPTDFLGVPMLTPTYKFEMAKFVASEPPHAPTDAEIVAEVRKAFHDPNPRASRAPTPQPSSGLREIADVVVYKRDYVITLVGEETINGHACYHLALQPVRRHDSGHRLRDLWVDETTNATERLKESTNFNAGPATDVPWTVDFADVAGVHYISEERADAPISYRGLRYTQSSIAFENVVSIASPPTPNFIPLTNGAIVDEPEY